VEQLLSALLTVVNAFVAFSISMKRRGSYFTNFSMKLDSHFTTMVALFLFGESTRHRLKIVMDGNLTSWH
jgi:hypothetical protein